MQSSLSEASANPAVQVVRSSIKVDLAFIAAFLVIIGTPLLWLKFKPVVFDPGMVLAFFGLLAFLLIGWVFYTRRNGLDYRPVVGSAATIQTKVKILVGLLLLLVLTFVTYYQPLKIHFWSGVDECLAVRPAPLWDWNIETSQNRPLLVIGHAFVASFAGYRLEPFLWFAASLLFLNAALIMGILRRVLPTAPHVAWIAAVLVIANRSDFARYLFWITNLYWPAIFLLLSAVWLLLVSYDKGSRIGLAVSCGLLLCSSLMYEASLPPACLAVFLIWWRGERQKTFVWLAAWCGTIVVVAVRLVIFVATQSTSSYQITSTQWGLKHPSRLLLGLKMHLTAPWSYFRDLQWPDAHWGWAIAAIGLTVAVCMLGFRRDSGFPNVKLHLKAVAWSVAALIVSVLLFLPIPNLLFRTHFYAAPVEAVILALLISLLGLFAGRRYGRWLMTGVTIVLVASSTVEGLSGQEKAKADAGVYFEKTVRIYDQLHSLAPQLAPKSLLLLVVDETVPYHVLGYDYSTWMTTVAILGTPMLEVKPALHVEQVRRNKRNAKPLFVSDSVISDIGVFFPTPEPLKHRYDQVAAFRLSKDGTVTLLTDLPRAMLPEKNAAQLYHPLAILKPGTRSEVPCLRYMSWSARPQDILDSCPGIMLGQGWSPLRISGGKLCRYAVSGAQIAVNPMSETKRTLNLNVKVPTDDGT